MTVSPAADGEGADEPAAQHRQTVRREILRAFAAIGSSSPSRSGRSRRRSSGSVGPAAPVPAKLHCRKKYAQMHAFPAARAGAFFSIDGRVWLERVAVIAIQILLSSRL
jgi:hypothetical protein